MTRTREELFLTAARDYGGKRMRKVSPFVLEALDMAKVETPVQKASAEEAIKRSAPPAQVSEGGAVYGPGAIPHLSYYQIDDYETCPLKYKFVHVLRVPIMSHHSVVYGKALHDAVQEYHRRKVSGRPVTADDLIEVYKGSWRSEGFISREHEQMRFQAGERALRSFFASQEASGILPTYVEKEFSFQVDGLSIKGRWDRVDVRDKEVSVIDFKSSEVEAQEDADKRTKGSLQLSIYALAYKTIYGKLPDKVQLHFLESGLIGTAKKKDKDMDKLLETIRDAASGIASQSFGATPGWHCRYCAYMIICEDAQR
jgi:DNA helicase-2/ATP-dependent DNA helicase PcrA